MTQSDSHSTPSASRSPGAHAQGDTRVITITSVSSPEADVELCDALLHALAEGARAIVLDLQRVEPITSTSRALLEAAGATLADRGGVLLVLTGGHGEDEPLVLREIRGEPSDVLRGGGAAASESAARWGLVE